MYEWMDLSLLIVVISLFTVSCSCQKVVREEGRAEHMLPKTKDQIVESASKFFAKEMNVTDIQQYEVTVTETSTGWIIEFEGKIPRPPGDEASVYVSKADGRMRIMQGE
jgi:hypothetical protein